MKIGIVWKNDYPWDVRIEKIAQSLNHAGHTVYIISSNSSKQAEYEYINGIHIYRLPSFRNNIINKLVSSPIFLNPFWIYLCRNIIKKEHIDLIIVRDIPLILIGILLSNIYRIPVLLDMAENYPAMYWNRIKRGDWKSVKNWFVKNPILISYIERIAVNFVDHIFVVVEESAKRILKYGAFENKVTIISNTPDLDTLPISTIDTQSTMTSLIYVGFVQKGRGIDTVIRSLVTLRETYSNLRFIVVGDGEYLQELKDLAKKLNVDDICEFKGWMKNSSAFKLIQSSDIGIIPHIRTEHTDTTIPNKLFDYMAAAKPVIVSNARPLARITNEEKCGVVFESGDSKSLASAISKLLDDNNKISLMGQQGLNAVLKKYNWKICSEKLIAIISSYSK